MRFPVFFVFRLGCGKTAVYPYTAQASHEERLVFWSANFTGWAGAGQRTDAAEHCILFPLTPTLSRKGERGNK